MSGSSRPRPHAPKVPEHALAESYIHPTPGGSQDRVRVKLHHDELPVPFEGSKTGFAVDDALHA